MLPPVSHLSPGQLGPFYWTSSSNATKAVESLLIPTAPEQHQQPTSLSGTQACEAAYSFTVPCYPHSLFGIPAPHSINSPSKHFDSESQGEPTPGHFDSNTLQSGTLT